MKLHPSASFHHFAAGDPGWTWWGCVGAPGSLRPLWASQRESACSCPSVQVLFWDVKL